MTPLSVEVWADLQHFREKFERLAVARDLFPLCDVCGRDLSSERLPRLIYIPSRNRFKCPTCPSVAA